MSTATQPTPNVSDQLDELFARDQHYSVKTIQDRLAIHDEDIVTGYHQGGFKDEAGFRRTQGHLDLRASDKGLLIEGGVLTDWIRREGIEHHLTPAAKLVLDRKREQAERVAATHQQRREMLAAAAIRLAAEGGKHREAIAKQERVELHREYLALLRQADKRPTPDTAVRFSELVEELAITDEQLRADAASIAEGRTPDQLGG